MLYLSGSALQSAELAIARYCLDLENQSGAINIVYVVQQLNNKYKLVPSDELENLTKDIINAFHYVKNQHVQEISRAGYWKFQAKTAFEALDDLRQSLSDIGVATNN
jgi:hypothetical protein